MATSTSAAGEYGSIVGETISLLENREREEESDSQGFEEELESVSGCNCKSQCTRKLKTSANGKVTGCPCKGYSLRCGASCTCGTPRNPCKNKTPESLEQQSQGGSQRQGGPSNTEQSVDAMLEALDHETLLKVAKEGFKARALVLRDLIASASASAEAPRPDDPQPSTSVPVPTFCVCGHCVEMPTEKERLCCKEKRLCRSQGQTFRNICLDSDNLATVIRSLADTYVFTPTYDNRAMRHAAYRQYIMWQHGHLGRGHRKVIPSCCVWQIRKHYPSPDGHYTGYKD